MRFNIRDVLWLTLAVALVAAWMIDRQLDQRRLLSQIDNLEVQRDDYRHLADLYFGKLDTVRKFLRGEADRSAVAAIRKVPERTN